jgi:hypothetical protein
MAGDRFGSGGGDRLPWLETVQDEPEGPSNLLRTIVLAIAGVALVAAAAFGIYRWQSTGSTGGDGALIAAQEGDYKIKPDDPGGLKVEGEGDSAIAASAGANGNASIDLRAVPETPIAGRRAAAGPRPVANGAASTSSAIPPVAGTLAAKKPLTAPSPQVPGAASGGALVQLGAFPSEGAANTAWSAIAKRFAYVAPLGKSVQTVTVDGRTFYRLRVNAGSADAAADVCARLKVAGESCFVTT